MKRKRIIQYLLVIAVIVLASLLLPYGIHALRDVVINHITGGKTSAWDAETITEQNTEMKKESESEIILSPSLINIGTDETDVYEASEIGKTVPETEDPEEILAKEAAELVRRDMLQELVLYKENFNPTYQEADTGIIEEFVGENEDKFHDAASEYAFGWYGSEYSITQIRFNCITIDDMNETVCLLEFYTDSAEANSDLVLCSYDKKLKQYIFQ